MSGEVSSALIGASMVGARAKPARTFPSGRTCEEPGCGVRLSVYNPSCVCGLHGHFEAVVHVARPARQRHSGRVGVFGQSKAAA
jgi:hypothetical protein